MTLSRLLPAAAAAILLAGCVGIDSELGGSMLPVSNTYRIVNAAPVAISVDQKMADSLSGFSSTRITVGAIRKDDEFGLTTRSSVLTLVPIFDADFDMGKNRIFQSLHFQAALDSVSVEDKGEAGIIQQLNVYELTAPLDMVKNSDCNGTIAHGSKRITKGVPVLNGSDSLSFWFSEEYGKKYLEADKYFGDFAAYKKAFPGFIMECSEPLGQGGRIGIYDLQLQVNTEYGVLTGNYAQLNFSAEYDGERRDTSAFFYFGATGFYDLDSLIDNSTTLRFPQYALNLTGHNTAAQEGPAGAEIMVEGGGGLKPVISAQQIRNAVIASIEAAGDDPSKAIINRATLNFNYVYDYDPLYEKTYKLPQVLSPTCRIHTSDTTVSFMGLTDSSSSEENQGDRNKSKFSFNPDITYHVQELLGMKDDNAKLLDGSYDIWLLIMHNDTETTTTSGNSDISDYYQYLAYQSYMSNMYGGYGGYGYGGYGYGYGSSYSNYYNYAMLAQMYGQSTTSTSTTLRLDADRYYYCRLYGPSASEESLRPTLTFTYSVPKE